MKTQIKNHIIVLVLIINVFLNIYLYITLSIHPFLLISSNFSLPLLLNEMQTIFIFIFTSSKVILSGNRKILLMVRNFLFLDTWREKINETTKKNKKKKKTTTIDTAIFWKSMFVVRKLFAEGVDKIDRSQFSAIIVLLLQRYREEYEEK